MTEQCRRMPYIVKGIGGFYYVQTEQEVVECRAKGIFRKRGIIPTVGDEVRLEQEAQINVIAEILPRKNIFVRPPVSNVDLFFIVASTVEPAASCLVIDKLAAIAISKQAQPVLLITKTDLASAKSLQTVYADAGFPVIEVNAKSGQGIAQVSDMLKSKLSVFCGNSGVGKSTLLTALLGRVLETGEISKKLGRGRHTTRQVTLYQAHGGLIADTPGFASLDLCKAAQLEKQELVFAFAEFAPYIGQCRFAGCSHIAEAGCAVKQAVGRQSVQRSRYESYVAMYEQVSRKKSWE